MSNKMRWVILGLVVCVSILTWIMMPGKHVKVEIRSVPVMADRSPLIHLLDRATIEMFEKEVKQHPEWVNQKSKLLDDRANRSVLTAAAITALTNHVRVLISGGADVADALKWCERYNFPDGTRLILDVSRELDSREVQQGSH